VFVELPRAEALEPLYEAAMRTATVLLGGLVLAALVALFMVRRMVGPIRLLQAGAARIGAGDLDSRIDVRTGDELESLADQFNIMAGQLGLGTKSGDAIAPGTDTRTSRPPSGAVWLPPAVTLDCGRPALRSSASARRATNVRRSTSVNAAISEPVTSNIHPLLHPRLSSEKRVPPYSQRGCC
jgi:methyl-accepting chemotaxis protein